MLKYWPLIIIFCFVFFMASLLEHENLNYKKPAHQDGDEMLDNNERFRLR